MLRDASGMRNCNDCDFPETPDKTGQYVCRTCGFTYPKRARVMCRGDRAAAGTLTPEERLQQLFRQRRNKLRDTYEKANTPVPLEEVERRLAACFTPCKHLDVATGRCPWFSNGTTCESVGNWFNVLIYRPGTGCPNEPEETSDEDDCVPAEDA